MVSLHVKMRWPFVQRVVRRSFGSAERSEENSHEGGESRRCGRGEAVSVCKAVLFDECNIIISKNSLKSSDVVIIMWIFRHMDGL